MPRCTSLLHQLTSWSISSAPSRSMVIAAFLCRLPDIGFWQSIGPLTRRSRFASSSRLDPARQPEDPRYAQPRRLPIRARGILGREQIGPGGGEDPQLTARMLDPNAVLASSPLQLHAQAHPRVDRQGHRQPHRRWSSGQMGFANRISQTAGSRSPMPAAPPTDGIQACAPRVDTTQRRAAGRCAAHRTAAASPGRRGAPDLREH